MASSQTHSIADNTLIRGGRDPRGHSRCPERGWSKSPLTSPGCAQWPRASAAHGHMPSRRSSPDAGGLSRPRARGLRLRAQPAPRQGWPQRSPRCPRFPPPRGDREEALLPVCPCARVRSVWAESPEGPIAMVRAGPGPGPRAGQTELARAAGLRCLGTHPSQAGCLFIFSA